jgi:hypothetical protein
MARRATLAFRSFCTLVVCLVALGCESIIGLDDRKLVAGDADGDGGTSDAGDGDGDGDADAGDAGGGPSELCIEYCDAVMDNCTGDFAVYPSMMVCLEVCARLPEGDPEDPSGNTVACRHQAARRVIEPPFDCPAAGPGGAGRCGENCEGYCTLMDQACDEFRLDDVEECTAKCAGLRDRDEDPSLNANESRFSAETSTARDHDGDTVQCRLFHVSVSTVPGGADAHCWHAALAPRPLEGSGAINPCLRDIGQVEPECEDYCQLIMTACTEEQAVYESEPQCVSACAALPPGDLTDVGGQNTLGCRKTHSYNALTGDPVTHCPHAGPGGAGVCSSEGEGDCFSFCLQLEGACADGYATEFGADEDARAACMSACEPLLDGESALMFSLASVEDSETPPLACRMRAVLRASQEPNDTVLCEQALGQRDCE